jgi:hypothetical protein
VPLVVRLEGTNAELGKQIINESGLDVIAANDLADGAEKIVKAVRGVPREPEPARTGVVRGGASPAAAWAEPTFDAFRDVCITPEAGGSKRRPRRTPRLGPDAQGRLGRLPEFRGQGRSHASSMADRRRYHLARRASWALIAGTRQHRRLGFARTSAWSPPHAPNR